MSALAPASGEVDPTDSPHRRSASRFACRRAERLAAAAPSDREEGLRVQAVLAGRGREDLADTGRGRSERTPATGRASAR